jgi:UDP-N-acetyl-D-galactosamine dehydrogenase
MNRTEDLFDSFYDAIVLAVSHREFAGFDLNRYRKNNSVVYDIKGILPVNMTDGRL